RQISARLEREHELLGRLSQPLGDGLLRREAVEGRVDLDGVEERRVVLEPATWRHTLRIHALAPVAVVPSGAADADGTGRAHRGYCHAAGQSRGRSDALTSQRLLAVGAARPASLLERFLVVPGAFEDGTHRRIVRRHGLLLGERLDAAADRARLRLSGSHLL